MNKITIRPLNMKDAYDIASGKKIILDLPILHSGTMKDCIEYSEVFGYEFVKDNSIFGGYFSKRENGHCLLLV